MSAPDPLVGMHWKLYGYVSRAGILPSPFDQCVTFTQVLKSCPKDCRFAVAQAVRIRTAKGSTRDHPKIVSDDHPSGPYVVWDLHDDQLVRGQRMGPSGLSMPPPPLWMGPNEDAMLMKAVSFYDYHP